MFESFEEHEGTPREVHRFESRWTIAMVLSLVIIIEMFDYSVSIVGPFRAVLIYIVAMCAGIALMAYASRRRSNVARLLLIPYALLALFYDLSHYGPIMDHEPTIFTAVAQLAAMAAAIYALFTPASRAWFGRRPLPPGALEVEEEL